MSAAAADTLSGFSRYASSSRARRSSSPRRMPRSPPRGGKYVPPYNALRSRATPPPTAHPPSPPGAHGLDRLHVPRIEVGPLLAAPLAGDVALVQHRRDLLVLERLLLHHVAPVARGVPDAEEDGLVLGSCPGERLVAPRVPV